MNTPSLKVVFGVILALVAARPVEARQPAVTAQLLPLLTPNGGGIATAINDAGHAVGMSTDSQGRWRAVLWKDGTVTNLGGLCDACPLAVAYGINNHDQVVGVGYTEAQMAQPLYYVNGAATPLPLPDGFTAGIAIAINNDGRIAGYGADETGTLGGIVWPSPSSAPESTALAALGINDAGDVAGFFLNACGQLEAAVLRDGAIETLESGDTCSTSSLAWAINASGVAAGTSGTRAVVWDGGVRTPLEPLAGFADSQSGVGAINISGDVVGSSIGSSTACWSQGTAWLPEGTVGLPSPEPYPSGCTLNTGFGINRHAQAVGVVYGATYVQKPVLWTIDVDRQDPEVTVATTTPNIAPPNKKMVPVTFTGTILEKNLASASYAVTDEYGLVQPAGSISVSPSGAYSFTVMLEARRDGGDKDRIYTIVVSAIDAGGRTGSASTTARVKPGKK